MTYIPEPAIRRSDYILNSNLRIQGLRPGKKTLAEFVKMGANIVGFVEAPPGSMITAQLMKSSLDDINHVVAWLNKPILCPKNPREPRFIDMLKKLKPDLRIVVCYQF